MGNFSGTLRLPSRICGLVICLVLATVPAWAIDPSNPFQDGGSVAGLQLRFADGSGGTFRPSGLVIFDADGSPHAAFPETSDDARSEDIAPRDKFSHGTGLGQKLLGREILETSPPIGEIHRVGQRLLLVLNANAPTGVTNLPVALSTDDARLGPVSYRLGRLIFDTAGPLYSADTPVIGDAFIAHGMLVLSARPAGALSIGDILKDLF